MKHTTTTEQNLAHIERLRTHGAKVRIKGELKEINSFFWDSAVSECLTKGYNAIAYELVIPETDEPLLLCIWADGHVDSGCERHVIDCMAQF